jgi:hypothetical protein
VVAAIEKGINGINPHSVNQTVLDEYEAEINSCMSTLDDCEAAVRLYSTYQTNAQGQANVYVTGDAPAIAMGNLYIATGQALENAAKNATRNQLLSLRSDLDVLRAGQ